MATCFGDSTGVYFSGYSCQSCAQRSDGLSAHPSARSRLRFPLFIPCSELQREAAEAFGSLRKGFIASFLTSAQMSTSLARFPHLPFPYHPPSVLFSSWPPLCSCCLSAEWEAELGGDLLVPRLFCGRSWSRVFQCHVQRCACTRSGSPPLNSRPCLDPSIANKATSVPLP